MAQRPSPIAIVGRARLGAGKLWVEGARSQARNLPLPPTPLIGREQECAQAVDLLRSEDTRLVTLYGTGGVGKTRLALAVAEALAENFPDGTFFVPLADIAESGLLLSTISQALELYTLPDETVVSTLIGYMKDMDALLVLDNFEQLLSAAPLLAELLSSCPRLKLLVTSRFLLKLRGERAMEVRPFPVTLRKAGRSGEFSQVERSPAAQLFERCAKLARPNFELNSENAGTIAEICARLDGLPLAIELAAARIKVLSPKALLARLQQRLQVLNGGAQDLPARQQTLRNTIGWSYELLDPSEQRVFRILSVFSDGCTLEIAQSVAGALETSSAVPAADQHSGLDLLEVVTSLVDKSLLRVVESQEDEPRLVMLETLREFAGERLLESNEATIARAAHAQQMLALAEEAERYLQGPEQAGWLDRLEKELGNLRVALDWSRVGITDDRDGETAIARAELGLRIIGATTRFWHARSHLHECMAWLDILLSRTQSLRTETRARALRVAGKLTNILRQTEQSFAYYQEAMEIAREQGDRPAMSWALIGIGANAWDAGDDAGALRAYEECLANWTELGHKPGIADTLNNLGLVLVWMRGGDVLRGMSYFEQSEQIYREIGDKARTALSLTNLGFGYLRLGDLANAEKHAREGLALYLEVTDQWNLAYGYGMTLLVQIANARKDYERCARLLAAIEANYDGLYDRLQHYEQETYTACLEASRKGLGDERFQHVWAEGSRLIPEEAVAGVVALQPARAPDLKAAPSIETDLSAREIEVLALMSQGLSNPEVAERLVLSRYTVNAHLRSIYSKLNVSSRAAATRSAIEFGLI